VRRGHRLFPCVPHTHDVAIHFLEQWYAQYNLATDDWLNLMLVRLAFVGLDWCAAAKAIGGVH